MGWSFGRSTLVWYVQFGTAEIGHIHGDGRVGIPFPRSIRNTLLDMGLAGRHHWVPNFGALVIVFTGKNNLSTLLAHAALL
jgi:hypothetical protein